LKSAYVKRKSGFGSFLTFEDTLFMKLNAIFLFALLLTIAASSACWAPKEVSASRSDERTEVSRTPDRTPSPTLKNSNAETKNTEVSKTQFPDTTVKTGGFKANLPANFQMPNDEVGMKLLSEYGSICVAGGGVSAPSKIFLRDEADVSTFQSSLQKTTENVGGFSIELQPAAMNSLKKAIAEAKQLGTDITPRAADSAKRTYGETVKLWESRVNPGLEQWVSKGRLSQSESARIKALPPFEQVPEILKLESQGMYFSKDFSKSILYSVAAPGASQHIFMLALDVKQYTNQNVREILAKNGWFQTVQSDLPHFTYLGVAESELAGKGLKPVVVSGQKFWIPNL
jgi:hypothetical protein